MADQVILTSITLNDLKSVIQGVFQEELKQFSPGQVKQTLENEYLTRREVCKRLKISLTTLHTYSKDGLLNPLQIGGKILFRINDVEGAVKEIYNNKYKHRVK